MSTIPKAIQDEIDAESELRYPVKRHNNPSDSPYVHSQITFRHGVQFGYQLATDGREQEKTVGQLLTEAIKLHELNPSVIEKELGFPEGIIAKLMNDDFYTNSVPVVLFKNLILSLHISLSKIEAAMLPTFRLVLSKETTESIKKKEHGYQLWENEESVIKYTNHLKKLFQTDGREQITGIDDNRPKPNKCYAKETGQGEENCVFPACHCGLPTDGREELEKEFLKQKMGIEDFAKEQIAAKDGQITALQSSLKDTTELWKSQMAWNLKLNQELNELNGQNVNLKSSLKEKDLIIHGIEEGSQQWEQEYKDCRKILQDIIEAESHQWNRSSVTNPSQLPLVIQAAKQFLSKYQHL